MVSSPPKTAGLPSSLSSVQAELSSPPLCSTATGSIMHCHHHTGSSVGGATVRDDENMKDGCGGGEVDEQELEDLLAAETEEFGWNEDILLRSLDEADCPDLCPTPSPVITTSSSASNVTSFLPSASSTSFLPSSSSASLPSSCSTITMSSVATNFPPLSASGGIKPAFKPPFSRSGQSHSVGAGVQNRSVSSMTQGWKAPRDDSAEFRGSYDHASMMYNIFNQVTMVIACPHVLLDTIPCRCLD